MTFSETESSPELRDIYHQNALFQIDQTRQICWPYYPPVDLLRLQLDERYPYGSHLMSLGDRVMFCGLIRSIPIKILFSGIPTTTRTPFSITRLQRTSTCKLSPKAGN
ncbi:MAG: hypothetical protein GVY17_00135 [Cyanobacteria bacterium]|jgi:hypothetical protein|nr:hypothetical protein [Cyanobacteria bacterium GSL.Bin21]